MVLQVTAKAGGLELDKLTVSTEVTKKVCTSMSACNPWKTDAHGMAGTVSISARVCNESGTDREQTNNCWPQKSLHPLVRGSSVCIWNPFLEFHDRSYLQSLAIARAKPCIMAPRGQSNCAVYFEPAASRCHPAQPCPHQPSIFNMILLRILKPERKPCRWTWRT